ncbi:MAG: sugar kinase [Deltaproteobacteria bacterium]|nr:sugar kinase [Deltaproteobacteria bacterium]
MKVAGLGQCSLDYIALVKSYPKEDTKEEALEFSIQGGGPAATALVALSRLKVKTTFLGRISDDNAGVEIKKGLKDAGVDVRGLKTKKGGKSQLAFITVNNRTGARTIFWQRPTVPPLAADEVEPSLIKKQDFLLLDGLMVEASLRAAEIAKKNKIPIMLDAGRVRPGMLKIAQMCDYIVCSEEFSKGISNTIKGTIKELAGYNPKAITITLGKLGSITWSEGKLFRQPAFKVRAVDTTGAGDVFHGSYIYGLLKGWHIRKTVEFASAFAALKCLRLGGRAGIPTLSETLSFIEESAPIIKKTR